MKRFSVHMDDDLVARLTELAKQNDRSLAAEIRYAVKAHVARATGTIG